MTSKSTSESRERLALLRVAHADSLCASIVSHRQGHLVAALLRDLKRINLLTHPNDEIILTLNAPEDESFLAEFSSLPLRVVRNSERKGFGANHNSAFAMAKASVFLILNPDLRLPSFDPAPMFEVLGGPATGLWAPRVLTPSGQIEDSARRFPTVGQLASRTLLGKRASDYLLDSTPVAVDWVAGMFMAFRRDVFSAIGGFDERYFMYMEDADICRRLRQLDKCVICDPRVDVIHDAQRASKRSLEHLRWHLRSAMRFLLGI